MSEVKETVNGNIRISDEVIVTIASVAVSEIEGVSGTGGGFVEGIARKLVKKSLATGIKATVDEETTSVDINIVVKYGVRIPEVAWNIQKNVKKDISNVTDTKVKAINIHVQGVEC